MFWKFFLYWKFQFENFTSVIVVAIWTVEQIEIQWKDRQLNPSDTVTTWLHLRFTNIWFATGAVNANFNQQCTLLPPAKLKIFTRIGGVIIRRNLLHVRSKFWHSGCILLRFGNVEPFSSILIHINGANREPFDCRKLFAKVFCNLVEEKVTLSHFIIVRLCLGTGTRGDTLGGCHTNAFLQHQFSAWPHFWNFIFGQLLAEEFNLLLLLSATCPRFGELFTNCFCNPQVFGCEEDNFWMLFENFH